MSGKYEYYHEPSAMLQVGLPQAKFVVVKCSVERRVELAAAAECKVERFEDVFVKARLAEAPRLVGVWALVKQSLDAEEYQHKEHYCRKDIEDEPS